MGQREERFLGLLKELMPQVNKYEGRIHVLAYWNNGEKPLGEIRQALVSEATGDYISFIDDDDTVPEYYCDEIFKRLGKVDYIGWQMQAWHNGEKLKPTFHSLRYSTWSEDNRGFYRGISHLNPIKRELALQASFLVPNGIAEDQPWTERVKALVHTEEYIDKVMYNYIHTSGDSIWRGDLKPILNFKRPAVRYKYFSYHPDSPKGLSNGRSFK